MSVNSKMTALADEIRTLSGTTTQIGIDAMTTHVQNANDEVESQTALLEQAIAALEGKASAGDAGGSGGSVETCTVYLGGDQYTKLTSYAYTHVEDGAITTTFHTLNSSFAEWEVILENVVVGSLISVGVLERYSFGYAEDDMTVLTVYDGVTGTLIRVDAQPDSNGAVYFNGDD